MTTNYLTFELTSRMEYEERLRQIDKMSRSVPKKPAKWLHSLRNFFSRHLASDQHPAMVTKTTGAGLVTPTAASVTSNRLMTEEEWLMLFRMVKSRKLSAEQAAQLLITLS